MGGQVFKSETARIFLFVFCMNTTFQIELGFAIEVHKVIFIYTKIFSSLSLSPLITSNMNVFISYILNKTRTPRVDNFIKVN